jgi:two-component system nitrogen regulation response regulator GlnG
MSEPRMAWIAEDPASKAVLDLARKVAETSTTLLITGESGTGKDHLARLIHELGPRRDAPFLKIDCASLPQELVESELFGHERGAFTGAQAMRRGRFEQAEGGTLFLDEIGDMPPDLQTRLLRVLSDGHFYRVGGHTPLTASVRVIAATHQDLEGRVKLGLFREDLYHRLNVIRLRLPPLRERREDIPHLARHFLQKSARELGVDTKRLSGEAMNYLANQEFPGNVRQLENICHWLTVMAPGQNIEVADLPPELRDEKAHAASGEGDWRRALEREVALLLSRGATGINDTLTRQFDSALITKALQHTGGRRIEAAQLLGIGRNTLTRKIQELNLDTQENGEN